MCILLTKHALNEYFTVILYNNKPVMLGGPFTVKKLDYVLCILFFQSLDRTKGRDELVFSSLDVLQLPKKQADAKIIESSTYNHK